MPGLLTAMDVELDIEKSKEPEYDFRVSHQEVKLEVDFATQSLKGWTQLTILPLKRDLQEIRIDARQCYIGDHDVQVNRKNADFEYEDPMLLMDVPDAWLWTAHQHDQMKARLEPLTKDHRGQGALIITIPKSVRIEEANLSSAIGASEVSNRAVDVIAARGTSVALDGTTSTPVTNGPTTKAQKDQGPKFQHLRVGISFTVKRFRDGLHFVGLEEGDTRFPHVYTKHSMDAGTASCIFPCVDDPSMRCTWEFSIKCSRTLGDALHRQPVHRDHRTLQHLLQKKGLANGFVIPPHEEYEIPLSDEEKLLEMAIICSGTLATETIDSEDSTKKVASFVVDVSMAAQHIGIAIGPFEQVDLSDFRETEDDEKLGQAQVIPVLGYCLPGRANEVRHACSPLPQALDHLMLQYAIPFPSSECRFVFVDDQIRDTEHTLSLSICSNRLLYSPDLVDPEVETTRTLMHAITTQWMGVLVVPQKKCDRWITIGLSHWMADLYMKNLCGHNDYYFRQKVLSDKLVKLDVSRPNLQHLGESLQAGETQYEFMKLKAPLVMFILDKRCVKASGSHGLAFVLGKIISVANSSALSDSLVSSESFRKQIERHVRYRQLQPFWAQWVDGAGCPKLSISQKFNKKRLCVEVTITQRSELISILEPHKAKPLDKQSFQREFQEDANGIWTPGVQPFFTGPMTIRIHEADGTPYEHIVEIKDGNTKIDIPYNTKYKRLKRKNLQKQRQLAGGQSGEGSDEALYYCLGDVLQSEEDVKNWGLVTWDEKVESLMEQESYEWIRLDADFEWLCEKVFVNMPSYMYVSQLQQDRDVVAQQEAVLHLGSVSSHPLPSTFLLRTVMDQRYFHGIRQLAAEGLVTHGTPVSYNAGLRHLEKSYQALFCYPNTNMPRPNDFNDRRGYKLESAMIKAFAQMRGNDGRCPKVARAWLLDILRFNDNTNNEFSDQFKIANLLSALTESIIERIDANMMVEERDDEADWEYDQFKRSVIDELDRYLRMDEWINSYQNIYTVTVLDCKQRLMKTKVIPQDAVEFARYLHDGTSDFVRIKAFEALIELGLMNVPSVVALLLNVMSTDMSPFMRSHLLAVFFVGLAIIAFGDVKISQVPKPKSLMPTPAVNGNDPINGDVDMLDVGANDVMPLSIPVVDDGLIIEEDVNLDGRQLDIARTTTMDGAIAALKVELGGNQELKDSIWKAIKSPVIAIREQTDLLDICAKVYDEKHSFIVKLPKPRFWKVENLGKGVLHFTKKDKFRTKSLRPVQSLPEPEKLAIKLNFKEVVPTLPPPPPPKLKLETATPKPDVTPAIKLVTAPKLATPKLATPKLPTPKPAAPKLATVSTPTPKSATSSGKITLSLKPPKRPLPQEKEPGTVSNGSAIPTVERPRKMVKLTVPKDKLREINRKPPNPAIPKPKIFSNASPRPSPAPRPAPAFKPSASPAPSTISVIPRSGSTPSTPGDTKPKFKIRKPLPDSGKSDKPRPSEPTKPRPSEASKSDRPRQSLPGAPVRPDKPRQPLPGAPPKSEKPRQPLPGSAPRIPLPASLPQKPSSLPPKPGSLPQKPSDQGLVKQAPPAQAKPRLLLKLKANPNVTQVRKDPPASG